MGDEAEQIDPEVEEPLVNGHGTTLRRSLTIK